MAGLHLAKGQDGQWRDNQGQGDTYHGHVSKDLSIGDKYDTYDTETQKIITHEVTNKEILETGHILIYTKGVS